MWCNFNFRQKQFEQNNLHVKLRPEKKIQKPKLLPSKNRNKSKSLPLFKVWKLCVSSFEVDFMLQKWAPNSKFALLFQFVWSWIKWKLKISLQVLFWTTIWQAAPEDTQIIWTTHRNNWICKIFSIWQRWIFKNANVFPVLFRIGIVCVVRPGVSGIEQGG